MNKEALLELLAKKDRTFRELAPPPGSALAELRAAIVRKRSAGAETREGDARRAAEAVAAALAGAHGDVDERRLEELPETAALIERARLYEIAGLAGRDDRWVEAAAEVVGGPAGLDGSALARLVEAQKLDERQAAGIGLAATLYEIVDRDLQLAQAIQQARFPAIGDRPAASTVELARVRPAEWERALASAGIGDRDGTPLAELAATLSDRFSALHPGAALAARLPKLDAGRVASGLTSIRPLLASNPKIFAVAFDHLDSTGLSPPELEQARRAHETLRQAVLAYPGLRLADVLDDPELPAEAKAQTVGRRIDYLERIHREVGEDRLLVLDYGPRSPDLAGLPLADLGASPEEQRMVLSTLKSHQRSYALAGSAGDAERLLKTGFPSARSVAAADLETFRARTGLSIERARHLHDRARDLAGDAAVTVGALLDAVRDPLADSNVGNVAPSALDHLRELDGFEQLFGSLSFCACEACQSILGPAAYFVDLMKFVDEHIRGQLAGRPDHPLDLRTRRPDLWTLELSCANTNDRIPVLQIACEVLEAFIAKERALVGSADEQRRQVYAALASAEGSFLQPFHLPIARAETYLQHLEATRAAVARSLGSTSSVWATTLLGISPKERQLLTTIDLDLTHHRTRYGVDFQAAGAGLAPVDVHELLPRMPFDRAELGELIATSFVRGGGATPRIIPQKRSPESVQNDIEELHGLTLDALDRIHRMARLRRHLPWTFAELDRALAALAIQELDATALERVAMLREVQARWSLAVDEACALASAMPRAPAGASWFDRVFNAPAAVAAEGALPRDAQMFVHPAFRVGPAPADPMVGRLTAALGVTLGELEQVTRLLAPHLVRLTGSPPAPQVGFDPADPDEQERGFVLSAQNLALLYRHVRLARVLGLAIPELFQLRTLANLPGPVGAPHDVLAIAELDAWRRRSGHRLDDLAAAVGVAPLDPSRDPDPAAIAAQILEGGADALTFQPTIFAVTLGVTESASAAMISANAGLFAAAGRRWRIADGVDTGTVAIAIPAPAVVTEPDGTVRLVTQDEVRGVLAGYRPSEVIARRLGAALSLDTSKVHALAALAAVELADAALTQAVLDGRPSGPVESVVVALRPLLVPFRHGVWDAAAIDHVRQHPSVYALSAPPALTLATLRALATATDLLASPASDDGAAAAPSDLRAVLDAYVAPPAPTAGFPAAIDRTLAQVLRVDLALVTSLRGRVPLDPAAALALEALARAARLARTLGLDGEALAALLSGDYATLSRGADALLAAVRARHRDEQARAEVLAKLDQPLLEARRDALADFIIRTLRPDVFDEIDELSPYFLLDVRAGGCQTSSRVIAATGSVQLYVHRIIMRLEQDRRPADDPLHVELQLPREAIDEWDWRKTYRVWEANRKVFLWPENYLEPDLRDDKTPLFAELEQELLQTEISEQNVLDAYAKYLAGFEELANLTIAGAYHDVTRSGELEHDVLHLFGVSSTDPPVFYHRTCESLLASGRDPTKVAVWTPWRKVNVQIAGRRVAPVVHDGRLHLFWTDFKTRSRNRVTGGGSEFDGYQHTMRVRFSTLRMDGNWTAPQELLLPSNGWFSPGRGTILDRLAAGRPWLDDRTHAEPIDDYTLQGPNWDWCWPEPMRVGGRDVLFLRCRDFLQTGEVDLFARELRTSGEATPWPKPQVLCARGTALYYGSPILWLWGRNAIPNLVLEERRLDVINREVQLKPWFTPGLYAGQVATLAPGSELLTIPGNVEDTIVQVGSDVIVLQGSVTPDNRYVARRIGTTLATQVARKLFVDGVEGLLDTETQQGLREAGLPLTPAGGQIIDRSNRNELDFKGPYGTYYREIFFHIPFLIANHLNSQGRFAAAQRWYRYVFDPTATEVVQVPPGTPPAERARRLRDRMWRYLEFRGLDASSLRGILTDPAALEKYRRNPFNPHAIARLRLSAYQKAIVMKYVDNLLDWGDHLFTQFTMEAVNEAVMLYLTAADILGRRPGELGACGEGGLERRDYEHIAPLVEGSDDLLVELETWLLGGRWFDWRLWGVPASSRASDS